MINLRIVARILGLLAFFEAVLLLAAWGVSLFYHEAHTYPFLVTTLVAVAAGGALL